MKIYFDECTEFTIVQYKNLITKGGKKMSDTTVQSPEEPKVNGGETADQEAKEIPQTPDPNVTDKSSSETKPFND